MNKKCSHCNKEKRLKEFHKKKGGKYGVEGLCKQCHREQDKLYRESDRGHILKMIYAKKYKQSEKWKLFQQTEKRKKANKESHRQYQYKAIKNLSDSYMKDLLKHVYKIPASLITLELIQTKREQLYAERISRKIKRRIYEETAA